VKKNVKIALTATGLAVVGGLFVAGTSFAERGFGPGGFGPRGMGPMGGFGQVRGELLKNVDANGDGAITQEEIDAAVAARLDQFDADKNGSLSLQEFEALWADLTRPAAVRAFQFLDPDGNANVSKDELDEALGGIVKRFDRNGDGKLTREDRPRGHRMHGRWSDDDGPGMRHHGMRHHRGWRDDGNAPRDGQGPRPWMPQDDGGDGDSDSAE
jgi:Ca2+-binding EF-hand superfamily protein